MNRILVSASVLLLALSLCACGSSSSTGGPGNGTLAVDHSSTSFGVIDHIVLRDQLGVQTFEADVTLGPGATHTFTEVLTGSYDVEVRWEDSHEVTYQDIIVTEGNTSSVQASR